MRSYRWALMYYDWCPCKKRRLGHRHLQREEDVKTQVEEVHVQARERGFRRTNPGDTLISDLQPPEL